MYLSKPRLIKSLGVLAMVCEAVTITCNKLENQDFGRNSKNIMRIIKRTQHKVRDKKEQ